MIATFAMAGGAFAASPSATRAAGGKVTATLKIIKPSVSIKRKGSDEFKPAKDGQRLRVGDSVQTDATGFAQVNYTDESLTRLDVNTTFTIVSLTDDAGNRKIKGKVDAGQTWNRTSALTESETFEQEGAGATAAVVGTAFNVECDAAVPQHCTFTSVIDGIQLTTIDGDVILMNPLEQCDATEVITDVDADLCAQALKLTVEAAIANQWILENLFLDSLAGFEGIIIVEDGQVVFVSGGPSTGGGGGTEETTTTTTPSTPIAPVIDPDNPISCSPQCDTTVGAGALDVGYQPGDAIHLENGQSILFVVNFTNASGLPAYVVFSTLPAASVGTIFWDDPDACGASVISFCSLVPVEQDAPYPGATEFTFQAAPSGFDSGVMVFHVETSEAESEPVSVDVSVEPPSVVCSSCDE